MKINICIFLILIVSNIFFYQCEKKTSYPSIDNAIPLTSDLDSLLNNFCEDINAKDSVALFVILKNIDNRSLKVYLIAKKPIRSDFVFIGIPFNSSIKNGISIYWFNGMEKIVVPDTSFWEKHKEIYDDRLIRQMGLYETPIIKKLCCLITDHQIQYIQDFDEILLINPPQRYYKI